MPAIPPLSVVRVWDGRPNEGGTYLGSAFFVTPSHLLTAAHVVSGCQDWSNIRLDDGPWPGGLRSLHKEPERHGVRDIALLTLSRPIEGWIPVGFGDRDPKEGDGIQVAGYASMTGQLETPSVTIAGYDGERHTYIAHTFIGTGMSGGAALRDGRIVGVTQARDTDRNRTYIIPLSAFQTFLSESAGVSFEPSNEHRPDNGHAETRSSSSDPRSAHVERFIPYAERYATLIDRLDWAKKIIQHPGGAFVIPAPSSQWPKALAHRVRHEWLKQQGKSDAELHDDIRCFEPQELQLSACYGRDGAAAGAISKLLGRFRLRAADREDPLSHEVLAELRRSIAGKLQCGTEPEAIASRLAEHAAESRREVFVTTLMMDDQPNPRRIGYLIRQWETGLRQGATGPHFLLIVVSATLHLGTEQQRLEREDRFGRLVAAIQDGLPADLKSRHLLPLTSPTSDHFQKWTEECLPPDIRHPFGSGLWQRAEQDIFSTSAEIAHEPLRRQLSQLLTKVLSPHPDPSPATTTLDPKPS